MYYLVDKSLKMKNQQSWMKKTTRQNCGEDLRNSGQRFHSIKHYEDGKESQMKKT